MDNLPDILTPSRYGGSMLAGLVGKRVLFAARSAGLLLLLLACSWAGRPYGLPDSARHANVGLIAETDSIELGRDAWIGLHFELEKGWHIYWINPGDSGEPPTVQWHLPPGLRAGSIHWPAPQRIEDHSLIDYGYEGETLLLVPIHVPPNLALDDSLQFDATVKWLVCRETCIPEQAHLTLFLPVQRKGRSRSHWYELFARTRALLPRPVPAGWKVTAVSQKDEFVLSIETGDVQTGVTFFPLEPNQIENAAPQEESRLPTGVQLKLRKSDQLLKPLSHLKGVVELRSGWAVVIDAPVEGKSRKSGARCNPDGEKMLVADSEHDSRCFVSLLNGSLSTPNQ